MRRAVFAFLGTAVGAGLMIGAKLGTRPVDADTVVSGQSDPTPMNAQPTGDGIRSTGPTPGPVATTSAPQTAKPPAPPPSPLPGGGLKNGTFPGTAVSEKYGTIKVTIVVGGGKVTDVTATYPTGGETGSINARAVPKLRQEVLTAQSANIAAVSGATYTSNAYKQSLQAALNAAKA